MNYIAGRKSSIMDNELKVHSVNWDVVSPSDYTNVLQLVPMGECIESLPYSISSHAISYKIPVPSKSTVQAILSPSEEYHIAVIPYLEFYKIKAYYVDRAEYIWKRVK